MQRQQQLRRQRRQLPPLLALARTLWKKTKGAQKWRVLGRR